MRDIISLACVSVGPAFIHLSPNLPPESPSDRTLNCTIHMCFARIAHPPHVQQAVGVVTFDIVAYARRLSALPRM